MQPIESSMLPVQPQHKHEGPVDKPCTKCGLVKKSPVHLADALPDDPPPEGGGTGYPPQ